VELKTIKDDLEFAEKVLTGDESACRRFVEEYTDWVLYRVRDLMKTHCSYPANQYICTLLDLRKLRKGAAHASDDRIRCDECMDSYIWMFDYLKKRLSSYKGKNNCSLKTYVFSIINSHRIYVDWLRWKYGRVF